MIYENPPQRELALKTPPTLHHPRSKMLIRLIITLFAMVSWFGFISPMQHGLSQDSRGAEKPTLPSAEQPAEYPAVSSILDAEKRAMFREHIAPILAARCLNCHGVKQDGGYSVATPALVFQPGDSDLQPITAKELDRSHLWIRLTTTNESERMPSESAPLPDEQLQLFSRWIKAGAPVDPADAQRSLAAIAASRVMVAPEHYLRPLPINALGLSPGRETVWVGGYAEVTQWRVATGELLMRVPVAGSHVAAIAISPDGQALYVSSGLPDNVESLNASLRRNQAPHASCWSRLRILPRI